MTNGVDINVSKIYLPDTRLSGDLQVVVTGGISDGRPEGEGNTGIRGSPDLSTSDQIESEVSETPAVPVTDRSPV